MNAVNKIKEAIKKEEKIFMENLYSIIPPGIG
jgi:hypothetical protein